MFSVVANTLMLKEATNIFVPQFVSKQKPRVVEQTIGNWCSANRLEASSIEDAKKLAIELEVHYEHDSEERTRNNLPMKFICRNCQ